MAFEPCQQVAARSQATSSGALRHRARLPSPSSFDGERTVMTHWDYIWIAYGLTAAALALELVLLFQRRRRARQMLEDQQDSAGDLQA